MMTAPSIVRQLLLYTLLTLFVLWMAIVISVTWIVKHETDEMFDASLQETAQRILPLAIMQLKSSARRDDDDDHEQEADEAELEPKPHKEYLVYQVFNAAGRLLLRSHSAPRVALVSDLKQGFQRTPNHWIYVEVSRNGEFLLALAEKSEHRTDTLMSTLKYLLLPLLVFLPLSALSLLVTMRGARKSLLKLDMELSRRSALDLSPVTVHALPQELQALGTALNGLMHRLQSAMDAERSFTANSAHELRTPLAAALVQLDVLDRTLQTDEQRKSLQTVRSLLQRLKTLGEKLLQLARAESGVSWKSVDVDLGQLLDLLCRDHQWRTELQLQLHLPASPVIVQGDVDALGIALNNLLENAIKYATPGSAIRIELIQGPAVIRIVNDCEPLPADIRQRLHERFFRVRPDSQGAGLGLSIVRSLLEQVSIEFELLSPATDSHRGFEARLTWPAS